MTRYDDFLQGLRRQYSHLYDWVLAHNHSTHVFVIFAISLACVVPLFDSPLYSFTGFTDHMRHAYAAWGLLNIGLKVFTTPIGQWSFGALYPFVSWPTLPHLYPLGSLVLFLPFGIVKNTGLLPESIANMIIIMVFGISSVIAIWLLYRTLSDSYGPKIVGIVVPIIGAWYVFWGLNGFFDTVVVALALYGVRAYWQENDGTALLALVGALSLHYRLWYLGPLAVVVAYRYWLKCDGILDWRLVLAGALGGGSLLSFVLTIPGLLALSDAALFRPNPIALTTGVTSMTLITLGGGVLLLIVLYRHESDTGALAALTLAVASVFIMTQWWGWYPILLTPTLGLVNSRPGRLGIVFGFLPSILLNGHATAVLSLERMVIEAALGLG